MHDPTSPRRISSPSAFPGPSRCSWPRNSSSRVGRMRAARGSAAELHCHLEIARDLGLVVHSAVEPELELALRVVRLLVGLLRKLGARTPTPFPFPHSPFPLRREHRAASS